MTVEEAKAKIFHWLCSRYHDQTSSWTPERMIAWKSKYRHGKSKYRHAD